VKGVGLVTARITEQPVFYEAVGTVTPGINTKLSSKILGTIESIKVREGDRVEKGDTLVIIDPRQVIAGVQKAEASLTESKKALSAANSALDAARAEEKLTLSTYERYKSLIEKKLISAQVYDEVKARYQQAKANLAQAHARVDEATARIKQTEAELASTQVTRKDAVIAAPHDGIITGKYVDVGDLATPGTPLLSLETTKGFCVDMLLPETYIDYVKPMQKVVVEIPSLDTGPLEGGVCTIVPSADQKSRTFVVKINLPIDRSVRSGMFARVQIPMGQTRKLMIDQRAVIRRGQLTGLFIVDSDSIAHFRLIRIGKRFGNSVEVLSGLKAGDQYVAIPLPEISDGVKVEKAV